MKAASQIITRAERYAVEVPVLLYGASGRTHNLSVTGVLFEIGADHAPPLHARIQFSLLFGASDRGSRLRMECFGTPVRIEQRDARTRLVAATIDATRVGRYFHSTAREC